MAALTVKDTNIVQSKMALQGYNLKKLSKEVGVTDPYLSLVIRGKRTPSPILAKRIADILGTEIQDIFIAEKINKS